MLKTLIRSQKGFTIVELIVVVMIIGILAGITIIGYGAWQSNVAKDQLENDLKAAKSAMDNARNFDNKYPGVIPTSFSASDGLTVTYVNGDDASYCIEAQSVKTGTLKYFVSSSDSTTPKEGSCPPPVISAPTLSTVAVTGSQAQLSWGSVTSATSYEIQYRRNAGAWSAVVPSTTVSKTITGLTLSSSYDFQVRAVGASSTSAWSTLVNRKTLPTPVISSGTDQGCGNSGGYYAWLTASITWTATSAAYTYLYKFDTGGTYGYTPLSVSNPTGSGTLTATTSTTQWPANGSNSGTVYLYGIGPNGEKSSPGTWTSPVHPAYDC
jgi:prepilin-type N-terminal cleavage/methylation domain-containing protein